MRAVHDGVLVDPARASGIWPDSGMHVRGQPPGDLLQVFGHARPSPVEVGVILKDNEDIGVAEHGLGTHVLHVRSRKQSGHDRVGDLVLNHTRWFTGPRGVNNHLHVADVGQGIERNPLHAPYARHDQQNSPCKNQKRIARAPRDNTCNHHIPPVALRVNRFVAAVWPPLWTVTVTCHVPPLGSCNEPS